MRLRSRTGAVQKECVVEKSKDMTEAQFLEACERRGIRVHSNSPTGYCDVSDGLSVCRYNGGNTRRKQLAHLLSAQDKERKRKARMERVRTQVGELPEGITLRFDSADPDKPYLVIKSDAETLVKIAASLREMGAARWSP
jgi:hypothetical protein